jgi:hypothetical protein
MNGNVHTQIMKIIFYAKDPDSGPLRGTAGKEFLVINPPRRRPVGGGGIHRN